MHRKIVHALGLAFALSFATGTPIESTPTDKIEYYKAEAIEALANNDFKKLKTVADKLFLLTKEVQVPWGNIPFGD